MIDRIREDDRYLTLIIGVEDWQEVERDVLGPLNASGVPAQIPPQGSGLPLESIYGFIEAAAAAIFVTERIVSWVASVRKNGRVPHLRLKRPNKAELDTATSTSDEIRDYIMREREDSEPNKS